MGPEFDSRLIQYNMIDTKQLDIPGFKTYAQHNESQSSHFNTMFTFDTHSCDNYDIKG